MKKSTDIAYYPKPTPGVLKRYLTAVLNDAPCGRDGIFESDYVQEKLNEFSWESHNLDRPTLIDFSKWLITRAKRPGRGRNGQRKSPSKESLSPEVAAGIIQDVEAITGGKITDSFLGSVCYNRIHHNLEKKHGITIKKDLYAKVIISRRKVKRDCNQNLAKVYFYYPYPIKDPSIVKLGYTTKDDPFERMKSTIQNIASEESKMIGWFNGTRKDEREAHKKFRTYRRVVYGNKEIYVFDEGPKIKKICDYFEEKIAIHGGKKENWPNHGDIIFAGSSN